MLHAFSSVVNGENSEVTEDLEQQVRTGNRQALLDLYALLQAYMARRAVRFMDTYRRFLPAYIESQDLAQEASLAMYQRLDKAPNKDSPAAYLVATGYHAMRGTCIRAIQEPRMTSLDAPYFNDDETPLREYIPSPQPPSPASSLAQEHTPLLEAVEQLPDDQRAIVMQRIGLGNQAAHTLYEIGLQMGKHSSSVSRIEHRAYVALYMHLKGAYPQYVEHVLASNPAGRETWQRLDQVYSDLLAQGQPITGEILAGTARADRDDTMAFLWERKGIQPLSSLHAASKRLDQAYADLCAQGEKITVTALARRARTGHDTAAHYLKDRDGIHHLSPKQMHLDAWQRLDQAYTDLHAQGEKITVTALARQAHTHKDTARKYLSSLEATQTLL